MDTKKIGVVGTGPMAAGIAQLCVQSGQEVLLIADSLDALGWAEDSVLRGLQRAEQPAAFSLLRKTTDLGRLSECDLAIETAADGLDAKRALLRQVDARLPPARVLVVHTSVLPIGLLVSASENPERVAGIRFFAPVPTSALVEVIRGRGTAAAAVEAVEDLARRLGKEAVPCKDSPGFIVTRLTRPYLLSGVRLMERGAGTPATIDEAVRSRLGMRYGPFEFADAMGLEEELSVCAAIYDLLGRPERLKPCAIQEKLLARGCRGRKNSRGFYVYGENPPGTVNPLLADVSPGLGSRPMPPEEIFRFVLDAVLAEAKVMAQEDVASPKNMDAAARLGMGWSRGPFEWAAAQGGG